MIPILIIGTGFSGLGLAIRLRQEGRTDFAVVERGDEVGGTWRDNTYPGCACDIQSHLYSFSFAPNPDWTRAYSPQPEILRYLISCADRFDVRSFIRFGTAVTGAEWAGDHWRVMLAVGEVLLAQSVVMAAGPLSEPAYPNIPGQFEGQTFHSAKWDPNFNPRGLRIGVIGNGASAVQFIPILQKEAAKLVVFQRTPAWVTPRPNRTFLAAEKYMFRIFPFARAALRSCIFWLREAFWYCFKHPKLMRIFELLVLWQLKRAVKDPILRAKLTPNYTFGCKRVLLSDDYWPALAQPNVEVITDKITGLTKNGVLTSTIPTSTIQTSSATSTATATFKRPPDPKREPEHEREREHERENVLDVLIYATGFRVTDSPFYNQIKGRTGESLSEAWRGSPQAYLGTMTRGFPNLFFLLGPNTGLGHTSVVLMIEAQIEHVLKVLGQLRKSKSLEPKASAQDEFIRNVDSDMKTTVWSAGGCHSWYIDRTGRNSTIWPKSVVSYKKLMESKDLEGYEVLS